MKNKPTEIDIREQTLKIAQLIQDNKKDIEFRCNDGAVIVNPTTLNFTYVGRWGHIVLTTAIVKNAMDNDTARIINLATQIMVYSMNNGGFNVITIN